MEKKYVIELKDNESVYKTIIANGYPMLQVIVPAPYTEPNLEQVREEAYQRGYCDALEKHCEICEEKHDAEEAYQQGLNDAWEAARKIGGMSTEEQKKLFGCFGLYFIAHELSAAEAINRIRQYEQEKEEIQVGDEVEWMGDKYVVTYVRRIAKKADLISCKFGSVCENVAFSALVKTGRHFPEIAEVLRKMREEEK